MSTQSTLQATRPQSAASIPSPIQALSRLASVLAAWQRRHAERRRLATLSNELLRDIGISRADALVEAGKPFWKA